MKVRLFKPRIREEAITAASGVMRSGWVGMGPKVAEFEAEFAKYLGVKAGLAVAVNTCTSALHLAVRVLELSEGDEVITSAATFVGANETLLYERVRPVFADVDGRSGNLTAESVAAKVTARTKAILITHFAGYACDLEGIGAEAKKHGLKIIEDCAHAAGAKFQGRRVGSSGNLCAFSFDPIKNLTTGDGGMLVTPTEAMAARVRNLRYMGLTKDAYRRVEGIAQHERPWEYDVPEVGFRYHMNDIAAAMGVVHLKFLDEENVRRNELVARYRAELEGVRGMELLRHEEDRWCSYHLFAVLAERRDALADKLSANGVIIGVHYTRNDAYSIFEKAELPETERFCGRVLSLPLHLDLTEDEIQYVCGLIKGGW